MKRKRAMRLWQVGLIATLVCTVLVGCGEGQATPAPAEEGGSSAYASDVLDTSYDDALDASGQLALGTLLLEETGEAVTAGQAAALLPLWQALQSGVVQGDAETQAVFEQIEQAMTAEQLAAIAAMQSTEHDLRAWMQEHGVAAPAGGRDRPQTEGGSPAGSSVRAARCRRRWRRGGPSLRI